MFNKILKYAAITVIGLCFSTYFIHTSNLNKRGEQTEMCSDVDVIISDSAKFGFIKKEEIDKFIRESPDGYLGTKRSDVDLYQLEQKLSRYNAIKDCSVSIDRKGIMSVKVTQRRPLFRIEGGQRVLYVDNDGYIFSPSSNFALYVPIITGEVPVVYNDEINDNMSDPEREWISGMINFVSHIENDPFLSAQIQQIDIEKGGDISLYTLAGDHKIVFGQPDNMELKFQKLMAFYKYIVPNKGWKTYSQIDLSYSDQIVCKRNK